MKKIWDERSIDMRCFQLCTVLFHFGTDANAIALLKNEHAVGGVKPLASTLVAHTTVLTLKPAK